MEEFRLGNWSTVDQKENVIHMIISIGLMKMEMRLLLLKMSMETSIVTSALL